jgi:hypothetical protein
MVKSPPSKPRGWPASARSRRARGLVGQALEDEPLDARDLAPVALEGLEGDLDPRREADHPVGTGADGRLLEALLAHGLDVLSRHDPAGAGRRGAIERDEVRPRLLETELDAPGIDEADLLHLVFERRREGAAIALERELHVVRRHRVPVVEADAVPEQELVHEPVRRHRPRLGEGGRARAGGHGLEERIVERVEHQEGRDRALVVGGIQPARGQREVHRPGHLPGRRRIGRRRRPRGDGEGDHQEGERNDRPGQPRHGRPIISQLPGSGLAITHFRPDTPRPSCRGRRLMLDCKT